MSLPYADRPEESNVYRTLSNKQIESLGARDFDIVKQPVFVDYPNEDELRRIGLVGRNAGMAQGGPPLSNGAASFTVALGNNEAYIRIPQGQVWEIDGYYVSTAATGTGILLQTAIVSFDANYGDSTQQPMDLVNPVGSNNQAFGTSTSAAIVTNQLPLALLSQRLTSITGGAGAKITLTFPFAIEFKHINYSSGTTTINGYMNRLR